MSITQEQKQYQHGVISPCFVPKCDIKTSVQMTDNTSGRALWCWKTISILQLSLYSLKLYPECGEWIRKPLTSLEWGRQMRDCHGSLSQDRVMNVKWPCSSSSQDCLYSHVLARLQTVVSSLRTTCPKGLPTWPICVHVKLSGCQDRATPLHIQPATLNHLTGLFICLFHFYFRIFVHVHAHSFIFSHIYWYFWDWPWVLNLRSWK